MKANDEMRKIREWIEEGSPAAGGDGSRFARAWRSLELEGPSPAPPGFARRVTARAIAEGSSTLGLPLEPRWARVAAALALIAGVAGGAGLGLLTTATEEPATEVAWSAASFAEEYVDGLTALAVSPAGEAAP